MFKIQDLFDKYGSFFNIMCTFWFAVKFPFNVQKRLYCEKRLLLPYPSFNCWIVAVTNPPTWFITTVCSLYGVQYTGDFHIWKGQCHKTFDPFFRKKPGLFMQTFLFSWRYSRNCVSALSTTMPRWLLTMRTLMVNFEGFSLTLQEQPGE